MYNKLYHDIVGIRAGVAARPASVVAFPPGVKRVHVPACIGIASRQRNRLDGFCELWGSKSQCDRAEPIRRRTLSQVDVLARHARIEDRDAFAELCRQVLRMNDAAWWIEHKNDAATTLAQDIEL